MGRFIRSIQLSSLSYVRLKISFRPPLFKDLKIAHLVRIQRMEEYTRSSHVRTSIPRSCQPRNYIREYVGALAGGTGAREAASEESQSRSTIRTAYPLNHRPIETFAASPVDVSRPTFLPHSARTKWMQPPRVYPGSESRLDGSWRWSAIRRVWGRAIGSRERY